MICWTTKSPFDASADDRCMWHNSHYSCCSREHRTLVLYKFWFRCRQMALLGTGTLYQAPARYLGANTDTRIYVASGSERHGVFSYWGETRDICFCPRWETGRSTFSLPSLYSSSIYRLRWAENHLYSPWFVKLPGSLLSIVRC